MIGSEQARGDPAVLRQRAVALLECLSCSYEEDHFSVRAESMLATLAMVRDLLLDAESRDSGAPDYNAYRRGLERAAMRESLHA